MTPVRVYSRTFLLNVGQVVTQDRPSLPLEAIRALRINNIYSGPKTHRGVSSGVNKRRKNESLGPGLTVGSLNIQSVRNKTDIIRDIVINQNIDILSLTETWITNKEKDDFYVKGLTFPGYEFSHIPRRGNCGYGGVGVLHKASIKVTSSEKYKSDSFENMLIQFNTGSRCLNLVTLYRPPPNQKNKFTNTQFFEEFSTFLQDRVTSSGDLLIVGDLNFHLDKKNDTATRKLTELLESFNILQCVNTSTHMSGHTLDVIMCRATDNLIQEVKVGDMITDHNLLLCTVHHPKPHLQEKKIVTRKLRSIDLPSFREDIVHPENSPPRGVNFPRKFSPRGVNFSMKAVLRVKTANLPPDRGYWHSLRKKIIGGYKFLGKLPPGGNKFLGKPPPRG